MIPVIPKSIMPLIQLELKIQYDKHHTSCANHPISVSVREVEPSQLDRLRSLAHEATTVQ